MEIDYGAEYDFEHDPDYQAELVKLGIAGVLIERMEELGVSRSELAERMGVSRARVTQILAGYANVTVRTLAAAALALDARVHFELQPAQSAAGVASPAAPSDGQQFPAPPMRRAV